MCPLLSIKIALSKGFFASLSFSVAFPFVVVVVLTPYLWKTHTKINGNMLTLEISLYEV